MSRPRVKIISNESGDWEILRCDEFEWFGLDGDKIHKKCKPNLDDACDFINNMTDEEFEKYLLGN